MSSFLTRAFNALARTETRSKPLNNPAVPLAAGWQYLWSGAHHSVAGEHISVESSLQDAAVIGCTRIIAESLSSLALRLVAVSSTGRRVDTQHNVAKLLKQPNSESDWVSFVESQLWNLILSGNQLRADTARGLGTAGSFVASAPSPNRPTSRHRWQSGLSRQHREGWRGARVPCIGSRRRPTRQVGWLHISDWCQRYRSSKEHNWFEHCSDEISQQNLF